LLAHGRWFSPGTLASSTTKTGRHDIAEILLKVALKHKKSIKSKLKGDLDFAFDQRESEVKLHKVTSLPESH
jgi:hypothetical protein